MYKMKSYCLKCRKYTEKIDPKVSDSSNGKTMILLKCAICGGKKSRFIKNHDAKGLLSKHHWVKYHYWVIFCVNLYDKMNKIVNNFLLAGDKFMPKMHLRQPGLIYSACDPFTKNKERI